MHGDADSRAPGAERVLNRSSDGGSINQLSAYLDATFASLRSTTRVEVTATATARIAPSTTFAERFAGVMSGVAAPSAQTRSIAAAPKVRTADAKPTPAPAAPKMRAAALRIDEREPTPPDQKPYQVASYAPVKDDTLASPPFTFRSDIRLPPLPQAVTSLVPLDNAPFPVRSASSQDGDGEKRVRINFRSRVSWEKGAFSDPRVLLHIPKGFDPNKPSVMVVFYHGHGATLTRDVLSRQEVPEQISEAGANAVLVAPQLAYDARSSNPGKLWESGAFARMVREAGDQLTKLYGDPRAAKTFATMPIIIVAYSGGYLSAATSLERGGLKGRVRGVVLLDALYGELGGFADWISHNRSGFFVSSWTRSTQRRNAQLEEMLADRDVTYRRGALRTANLNGSVVFLAGEDGIRHRDFVNHAWADKPIKDILVRLPEYRL